MTKKVTALADIPLLGKSLDDLANEIQAGRSDAVAGIQKMADAYAEGLRRFPTKAEEFFRRDPRTKWISKNTRTMLRMVANRDLDPRVVLIPEPNLAKFISELPYNDQKALLDLNPYVEVYDCETGKMEKVEYIDIKAAQTRIAYDHANQRFRTAEEQKQIIANLKLRRGVSSSADLPYKRIGNVVRFKKGCEIGRNEFASLCRELGFEVKDVR